MVEKFTGKIGNLRFRNLLNKSDEDFYIGNAQESAEAAIIYVGRGIESFAYFYAERAAQYYNDLQRIREQL